MRWFYDLKTFHKLVLSFGVVIVALCSVAFMGLRAAEDARSSWEAAYKRDLLGLDAMRRVEAGRLSIARHFRHGMLVRDEGKKAERAAAVDKDGDAMLRLLDEIDQKSVLEETKRQTAEIRKRIPAYVAASRDAIKYSSSDMPKAMELHQRSSEAGIAMGNELAAIADTKKQLAAESFEQGTERFERSRAAVLAVTFSALALAGVLALVLSRAIARPLGQAVSVLDRVAEGDLSQSLDVRTKDEVGAMAQALSRSIASMRSTLASVQNISIEVSAAATQLAAGAEQISGGAQTQAASLEETAASLEEMSSTVKQNAENASQAAELASGARDVAERGGEVVEAAVLAMREINGSSKRIGEIITTIDEIAFQTNLLALNAAVEAARAGDQGRGFGVVAAEVRSLAQRTASAAREIRGLIADSSRKVEVGTEQVNHSGETLTEIVRSVKRVTDMVVEIASASREQNAGIDQVNTAVSQVDHVTQTNASQTEELSATAASLRDKSAELRELVSAFVLGGDAPRERDLHAPRAAAAKATKRPTSMPRVPPPARSGVMRSVPPAPMRRTGSDHEF